MGAPIGNQNAAKAKMFGDRLRNACIREDWKRVNQGIEELLIKVSEGERWAIELVRDTFDGKPAQAIVGGGEDSAPIKHAMEVVFRAASGVAGEATSAVPPESV